MRITTHTFTPTFMPRPPARSKRAANVTVRRDLLDAARAAGLNLSATLETALERALAEEKAKRWRDENSEAIAAYNDYVEKHGTFSDDVRGF
jgi:antitoxin CcdA